MHTKWARRLLAAFAFAVVLLSNASAPLRATSEMRSQDVEYFFYHTLSDMENDVNLTGYRICPCIQGPCAYGGLILDDYRRVVYTDCEFYSNYGCLYHYNGDTWDVIDCF